MRMYLCLFLLLCSCASERHESRREHLKAWVSDNGKVKVLSTTAIVDDLVKRVGGEHVDTMVLIQGDLDPHSYQLVKGDDEKFTFAHAIFYSGLGLEHGPSLQAHLLNNPKAVALGDSVESVLPEKVLYVRGQRDPHMWMDPSLWSQSLPFIAKVLSERDPAHANEYRENALRAQKEFEDLDQELKAIMATIPQERRYLVTSHDAFNYFARAYLAVPGEKDWSSRFTAPEGMAPESQISASSIQAVINHLKKYDIHVLFPESNVSPDSIRKIVDGSRADGLEVKIACCPLYGDAMGEPGSEGDSYPKMLLYNARTFAREMQ